MPKAHIAKKLGVSPLTVSKDLQDAKKERWAQRVGDSIENQAAVSITADESSLGVFRGCPVATIAFYDPGKTRATKVAWGLC
jgi:hypothetical protein